MRHRVTKNILYYIFFWNAPTGLTIKIDTFEKSPQKKIDNKLPDPQLAGNHAKPYL